MPDVLVSMCVSELLWKLTLEAKELDLIRRPGGRSRRVMSSVETEQELEELELKEVLLMLEVELGGMKGRQ